MFERILIANRGEIAARVARTCRRMGIATVGVTSWADREALHARAVDTVVPLGPSASHLSYLDSDRLLAVARRAGVDAVHPGYGFLSENAEFAAACEAAGFRWIGPTPDAIRLMGDKDAARSRMERTGVPVLPGFPVEEAADVAERCRALGYPVLVKAVAGGGGRGLRRVDTEAELGEALNSAAREAEAAFGDGRLLIEKLVTGARHVEVQILADGHGRTVHLFERDCSLQRRHQKVIEEAPAPGLGPAVRAGLTGAACEAASAIGYVNAGTVEFLLANDDRFYFIEMNTRLQVEHPVTECVTGLDLVEWQIRIAAGEPLDFEQDAIPLRGHAIEARVCAEDPAHDFRPQPGPVREVRWPAGEGIRVDAGIASGDRVPPHYDSLIAKVIAFGEDREEARSRLVAALQQTRCAGPATNLSLLSACLEDPAFCAGQIDTGFIPDRLDALSCLPEPPEDETFALAAVAVTARTPVPASGDPWRAGDGWRGGGSGHQTVRLSCDGRWVEVCMEPAGAGAWTMRIDGHQYAVSGSIDERGALDVRVGGIAVRATAIVDEQRVWLFLDAGDRVVERSDRMCGSTGGSGEASDFASPMPGRVTDVQVEPGSLVAAGATLLIVEAMKIEHRIEAPSAGRVTALLCEQGAWINEGEPLVEFAPEAG